MVPCVISLGVLQVSCSKDFPGTSVCLNFTRFDIPAFCHFQWLIVLS